MWNIKLEVITTIKEQWIFIGGTILVAFIFTNIFQPFDIYSASETINFEVFLSLNIGLIIAFVCLVITQFVIKKIIQIKTITYGTVGLWFLFDVVVIGSVWTIVNAAFETHYAYKIQWITNIIEALAIFILPYFLTLFYLNYHKKKQKITTLLHEIDEKTITPETMITFSEQFGKQELIVPLTAVLYIEANDNYVTIQYHDIHGIKNMMLRNTLKNLEPQLQQYMIIRCHRSYMVNILNVASRKKTDKGIALTLQYACPFTVPVSKTYVSEVNKLLTASL